MWVAHSVCPLGAWTRVHEQIMNKVQRVLFQLINLTNIISDIKNDVILISCTLDIKWWEWHFTSVIFLQKCSHSHSNHEKNIRQIPIKRHSAKFLTSSLQSCQGQKCKVWLFVTGKRTLVEKYVFYKWIYCEYIILKML